MPAVLARTRHSNLFLAILFALLTLLCLAPIHAALAQSAIPLPTGPYRVGRTPMIFRDASRIDPYSPRANDARRLAVLVWYPASPRRGSPLFANDRADFTSSLTAFARVSQAQGQPGTIREIVQGLRGLQPNVFEDLSPSRDRAFPLVLLSHGLGSMPEEYDSLAEDLASRGMIVVGVNHTYASFASMYLPDRPTYSAPDLSITRLDLQADVGAALNAQWAQDLRFVLDRMLQLNASRGSEWYQRIDTSRIAAAGHSFGGSASVTLAFTDSRVRCAVEMDGSLWGQAVSLAPNKPVMFAQAEGSTPTDLPESPSDDELAQFGLTRDQYNAGRLFLIASNAAVANQSSAGGCWVRIAGAVHQGFSDYALIGAADSGTIDPSRFRALLRTYVHAFLSDQFFGTRSGILRAAAPAFPEVTVVRPAP